MAIIINPEDLSGILKAPNTTVDTTKVIIMEIGVVIMITEVAI